MQQSDCVLMQQSRAWGAVSHALVMQGLVSVDQPTAWVCYHVGVIMSMLIILCVHDCSSSAHVLCAHRCSTFELNQQYRHRACSWTQLHCRDFHIDQFDKLPLSGVTLLQVRMCETRSSSQA